MGLDKLGLGRLKGWLQRAVKDQRLVRTAVMLGMAGIVLIWLSSLGTSHKADTSPAESEGAPGQTDVQYRRQLEEDLRRIVHAVTGDSDPQVMITLEDSGSGDYASDSSEGGDGRESSYVILKDGGGGEHGLALRQKQPRVQGAVIVCSGAGDPAVREKLVNAARAALGLSAGRVCVVENSH